MWEGPSVQELYGYIQTFIAPYSAALNLIMGVSVTALLVRMVRSAFGK